MHHGEYRNRPRCTGLMNVNLAIGWLNPFACHLLSNDQSTMRRRHRGWDRRGQDHRRPRDHRVGRGTGHPPLLDDYHHNYHHNSDLECEDRAQDNSRISTIRHDHRAGEGSMDMGPPHPAVAALEAKASKCDYTTNVLDPRSGNLPTAIQFRNRAGEPEQPVTKNRPLQTHPCKNGRESG